MFRVSSALFTSQYALMLEYRAEIILWAISGLLPLIMLSIWSNVEVNDVSFISADHLIRYFISAFVVRQFTAVWVMVTFEEDYIEGKLSPFLLQPLQPFWRYFFSHIAEQVTRVPIVILMLIIVFLIKPDYFFVPKINNLVFGIVSIVIAFTVRFIMHWAFSMLCFWNERSAAIERLLLIPYVFLSGLVAPLDTFPESIRSLVMKTPFPYFLSFPARVISGLDVDISHGFLMLLFWGFFFFIIGLFAWNKGIKRYSAMGA